MQMYHPAQVDSEAMGKGSNSSGLRRYNERAVLTALRKMGTASKSDLARASNLTPQAITRIVDDLESTGLVAKRGRRLGKIGQPSTMYVINPTGAYSIGVKVGRQDIELLLMDFGGSILDKLWHRFEYPDPDFVLMKIEEGVSHLVSVLRPEDTRKLMGVGVAIPWFMGAWTKEPFMKREIARKWNEINFADELAKVVDLPLFIENDCSAAAVAELQFGIGNQISNFLYVFIGTFIGGGLVLHGNLETGIHGNACSLGTMPVPRSTLDTAPEHDGVYEILLDRASLFCLIRHLNNHEVKIRDINGLDTVMDEARPLIQQWLEDCADALVYVLMSAIGVLDIESIVIDAHLPRFLLNELVEIVSRRIQQNSPHTGAFIPDILVGSIGVDAIAVGGAILPFYSNFAADKTVMLKGGVPEKVPA